MPRILVLTAVLAVLGACSAAAQPQPVAVAVSPSPSLATPGPSLPPSEPFGVSQVTLRGPDGKSVDVPVYVAADGAARQRGLMDRDELPAGTGMVFLFPSTSTGAFWMYRTRIPLSIAFFGEAGDVLAVLDMTPCRANDSAECKRYDPGAAYVGALEVNQGFFAEQGVGEGWTVELPDDLTPESG